MKIKYLVAITVCNKCIPKSGNVNQEFCQSHLADVEVYIYICTPPTRCPLIMPTSYLRIKKTLWGSERSPHHDGYKMAKKILLTMGFTQSIHSPCLFQGILIEDEPPLYLGPYEDDFIYSHSSTMW